MGACKIQWAVCYKRLLTYPNIHTSRADAEKWMLDHPDPENCEVIYREVYEWRVPEGEL
ncbi:hypothetical protein ABH922_003017 [Rhodococcus sp. 27YEA15]